MVARTVPQTPLQHAQRHGQQRGMARARLPGQPAGRTGGLRAGALHPHALAGGLFARAGVPARLPDRGGPFAREPHPEHHPSGLDGAHDERHDDLQREYRHDSGGQHPRSADPAGKRQHAREQGARDAVGRGFAPARPDGGRRPLLARGAATRGAGYAKRSSWRNPSRGSSPSVSTSRRAVSG